MAASTSGGKQNMWFFLASHQAIFQGQLRLSNLPKEFLVNCKAKAMIIDWVIKEEPP